MENLYSVSEAARRLGGLSPYTIHSWLSKGKLKRVKLGGRTLIAESELERLIAEGDGKKERGRSRLERQQR
jgi:excisionase family DNA binding protein